MIVDERKVELIVDQHHQVLSQWRITVIKIGAWFGEPRFCHPASSNYGSLLTKPAQIHFIKNVFYLR